MKNERSADGTYSPLYQPEVTALVDQITPECITEAQKLMERHSTSIQSGQYHVPPSKRIEIFLQAAHRPVRDISSDYGVSSTTCTRIIHETRAALAFLLGEENTIVPWSDLNVEARDQLHKFILMESKKQELEQIRQRKDVQKVLSSCPPLDLMFSRNIEDGAITPLLVDLGLSPIPVTIESKAQKFMREGVDTGGMYVWLRRILYQSWLNSESYLVNNHGARITTLIADVADASFNPGRLSNSQLTCGRNIRHFLSYMTALEFSLLINNNSVDDNEFEYLFPVASDNNPAKSLTLPFNRFQSISETARQRLSTYGGSAVIIDIPECYRRFEYSPTQNQLSTFLRNLIDIRERGPIVRHISNTLYLGESSARKVYDYGLRLADTLLLIKNSGNINVLEMVRRNPLQRGYREFRRVLQTD